MKQLFFQKGNFTFLPTNKAAKGMLNMTKWFKKIATRFNIPFVDDCCDAPTNVPLRFNNTSGEVEAYDPVTNAWIPAVVAEDIPGEIKLFAGDKEPAGWAFCDGQLIAISQNPKLYEVFGVTYGGDNITTMQLPDLRGRVPMGEGTGPGLTARALGDVLGTETLAVGTTLDDNSGAGDFTSDIIQPSLVLNYIIKLG